MTRKEPLLFSAVAVILATSFLNPSSAPTPAYATPATVTEDPIAIEGLRSLVADPNGPRVVTIPPGVSRGDLVIRRPLILRGAAPAASILEGSGADTVLRIEADDVVVENLTIRRSGRRSTAEDAAVKAKGERIRIANLEVADALFGIILAECRSCVLDRVHVVGTSAKTREPGAGDLADLRGDGIKLWESHDSVVRQCVVEDSRDIVVWYTRRAVLDGNTVRRSRYGSHFMYAHDATVMNSHFESNTVGVFVMYSRRLHLSHNLMAGAHGAAGVGLGFKDSDEIDVRGNWLVANTTGGYFDNTPRTSDAAVILEGNVVALNDVGMKLHGTTASDGLHLRGNDFRDNSAVVEVDGGNDALKVDVRGNYFSDYEGYDLDGNGVGDVAYEVKTLSSELTEAHPSLRFFHGTAAMATIDAVAHAVPIFAAKRLLVDPAPLVKRPTISKP